MFLPHSSLVAGLRRRGIRHIATLVTGAIGAWMACSPLATDYQQDRTAAMNAYATGALLLLLGVGASLCFRRWMCGVAIAIALWMFQAPWALDFVNVQLAALNTCIGGGLVFLLAIWTLLSEDRGEDEWPPAGSS
jgi:hypothetical protein